MKSYLTKIQRQFSQKNNNKTTEYKFDIQPFLVLVAGYPWPENLKTPWN